MAYHCELIPNISRTGTRQNAVEKNKATAAIVRFSQLLALSNVSSN
jgi:hypothetical protein